MRKILSLFFALACVCASLRALEIEQLDPAMAARPADTEKLTWHMPYEAPMRLCGFPWFDVDGKYARLPIANRPEQVTQYDNDGIATMVDTAKCGAIILSVNTAGGQVRFKTDSSCVAIHAELVAWSLMYHMTVLGSSGFDLYVNYGNKWNCVGISQIKIGNPQYTANLVSGLKREMHDVIINFPLYSGVKSLAIGLDKDAKIEAPTPFRDDRPIVFYGTSITQGGCATRPGMASSNILSRMLNREVINEGFSGNGKGEPEIAEMLAEIPNASLYILDYVHNTSIGAYKVTLPKFIDALRAKHPETPILVVSGTPYRNSVDAYEYPSKMEIRMRDIAKEECQKRNAAGDKNIYLFDIYELWTKRGDDFSEWLVDGAHMTDMGFMEFAKDIAPEIKRILGE